MVGDTVLAAEEAKAIFLRPATSALRTSLICQGYNFLIKNKAWRLFKRFFRFFSTWSANGCSHAYILMSLIELIISFIRPILLSVWGVTWWRSRLITAAMPPFKRKTFLLGSYRLFEYFFCFCGRPGTSLLKLQNWSASKRKSTLNFSKDMSKMSINFLPW